MAALLSLQAVAEPGADTPQLKRRTIALSTGGKTSDVALPIGVPADLKWSARKTEFRPDGSIHLSGQVQLRLTLDKLPPLSLYAEEATVRSETLDAGQAQAVRDLQQMGISDQSIRGNPSAMRAADGVQQEVIDRANMQRLAAIVQQYGWPGNRFGGIELAGNAFAVLQHADRASQHRYLPLLRRAVALGDANAQELAMLEDRVLMGDGKPQLYGTQFRPFVAGQPLELYPVQDAAQLDQRRSALGMAPMADYLEVMRATYKTQ